MPSSAPFLVEDFRHPAAERIGAENGIRLLTGNGAMLWVPCSAANVTAVVESYDAAGYRQCFAATATPAWLSLEITGSFGLEAPNDKTVEASWVDGGVRSKATVAPGRSTPVSDGTGGATVVELRVN